MTADDRNSVLHREIAELERRHSGRLGVAILDTARMELIAHRGDEHFPMCSTSKYPTAALVMARIDRKEESLTRRIVYSRDYLVPCSPFTAKHAGDDGVTVGEICDAALTLSDNTAENLLLDSFGGPMKLTAYTRSLGDSLTRFDRREPELNEAIPGDPRDTTTPVAMLKILHRTILGTALSVSSREQLTAWLVACKTGDKRLRAGVPKGWRVGDKTGSSANNVTNDIAIIWPPGRAPIIATTYYAESRASTDERNAVLSEVGRLAATVETIGHVLGR